MTPRNRLLAARIAFFLYLAAIVWLCFGQFDQVPQMQRTIWGIPTDKIAHFLMFFPFPLLAYFAFDRYSERFWPAALWSLVTLTAGLLIAAGTEVGQARLTTYRSGDVLDFQADFLALGTGTLIVLLLIFRRHRP